MTTIAYAAAAAIAALVGGYIAIKGRRHLNVMLGFTAGIILGLVAFDLLPEIFGIISRTGLDSVWPMIALTGGFLAFHIVEKSILMHHSHEQDYEPHSHPQVGLLSAVALAAHSFLDGVAIGVAFKVSPALGLPVAIAVIAHRFADGFNTTNVMLYHRNQPRTAKRMLYLAAIMPILGALATQLGSPSEESLGIYLGFFAGFLLYIGASDILPQAHSKGSSKSTIALTILGTIFMFAVVQLA